MLIPYTQILNLPTADPFTPFVGRNNGMFFRSRYSQDPPSFLNIHSQKWIIGKFLGHFTLW